MKTRALMAVALTAAVCASAVWSQGRPGPGRPERPGGPPAISTVMAIMPPPAGMFDRLVRHPSAHGRSGNEAERGCREERQEYTFSCSEGG